MSDTKNIPLEYINYLTINDQIDNEKNSLHIGYFFFFG